MMLDQAYKSIYIMLDGLKLHVPLNVSLNTDMLCIH